MTKARWALGTEREGLASGDSFFDYLHTDPISDGRLLKCIDNQCFELWVIQ